MTFLEIFSVKRDRALCLFNANKKCVAKLKRVSRSHLLTLLVSEEIIPQSIDDMQS